MASILRKSLMLLSLTEKVLSEKTKIDTKWKWTEQLSTCSTPRQRSLGMRRWEQPVVLGKPTSSQL